MKEARIAVGTAAFCLMLLMPAGGAMAAQQTAPQTAAEMPESVSTFDQNNSAAVNQKNQSEALSVANTVIIPTTPPVQPPPASNLPVSYINLSNPDKIHSAAVIVSPSATAGYNVISVISFTKGATTYSSILIDTANPHIIKTTIYNAATNKIITQTVTDYRSNRNGWNSVYNQMIGQINAISAWPGGAAQAAAINKIKTALNNSKTYLPKRYPPYTGTL